jgi:hypothetical protein
MQVLSPTGKPLSKPLTTSRMEHYLVILPLTLGTALVCTNRWYAEVDDEYAIIESAAKPVYQTVGLFLRGVGEHEHPPLYDILLHGWLRLTGGNEHLLRIPAIFFFVLGAWVIAKVAKHLEGIRSQIWVLIITTLWPFGFHFGRLATWYSFCFFLVSLLTLNYFNFLARPTGTNWLWLLLTSLAFVYSNYFGWVLLVCLALDYVLRDRLDWPNRLRWLLLTGTILFGAYIPLLRAFVRETHLGIRSHGVGFAPIANGIYGMYCMFVSESVAPWFWFFGVPAGIAISICLLIMVWQAPATVRGLFLYFLGLFTLMVVLEIAIPKRLLLISPWLILPIGVTLGTVSSRRIHRILIAMLVVIAGIGWYGIFSRRLYAAPHWIEPWESVARQAAGVVHDHGIVVGNNASFFFYLTYLLPTESSSSSGSTDFAGFLPDSLRIPGVYDPQQWIEANHPVAMTTLLVKGLHYGTPSGPTSETELWLDEHCNLTKLAQMVRDTGSRWKQEYAPGIDQPEWRIEVRTYGCR